MPEREGADAIFTFNGDEMKKFFKSLGEGVDRIGGNMKNMTQNIASGVKTGIGHFAKLGIVFVGLKKLMGQIPEIGQAFGIAKDIALRNFLWPLRKMLMPLLQGMLDWVRDHRAQFVKWGQVVANVFKGIISVVKSVFSAVKSIIDGITRGVSKALGGAGGTAEEMMNLLQFKLTGIMMFIGSLIKKVGDAVGKFVGGFISKLGPAADAIGALAKSIAELFAELFGKDWDWESFGKGLGEIVGGAIKLVTDGVRWLVDAITDLKTGLTWLTGSAQTAEEENLLAAKTLLAQFKRMKEEMFGATWALLDEKTKSRINRTMALTPEQLAIEIGKGYYKSEGIMPSTKPSKKVQDAVITPRGDVIQTAPTDYLIATKNPGARFSIQIGPIYVEATQGNATEVGKSVGLGIVETLRSRLLTAMVREGE